MMIPAARLIRYAALLPLWGVVFALWQPIQAQTDEDKELVRLNRRLNSLIRSIDDIKWSNIIIFRLEDEYKARLTRSMEAEDKADLDYIEAIGQTIYDEPLPDFASTSLRIAGGPAGGKFETFLAAIARNYSGIDPADLDETQARDAYARARAVISKRKSRPSNFYLITSRDKNAPRLIALLGVSIDEAAGTVNIQHVWSGNELYSYLRNNGPDSTMYTELRSAVGEGGSGLSNQMFVLRDLSEITFAPPTRVQATYLDENKYTYVLTSISEGRPLRGDYVAPNDSAGSDDGSAPGLFGDAASSSGGLFGGTGTKSAQNIVANAEIPGTSKYPHTVTLGTDVIAAYEVFDVKSGPVPAPTWGVELRNGFDEINYPSIWGGRMTLNAILENIKIGAVLPQFRFGGGTIDSSGIGSRQQKIIGGYGIAFSGDFTAPLLNNSGLFNFYASYTFSEAPTDKMGLTTYTPVRADGEQGYLARFAFQAYYSFGFYADPAGTHLFRLKLGGTVYGIDTYIREEDTTQLSEIADQVPTLFTKRESVTIGGVSGRLEYMKGGQKIPWGAGLQYFDQSLLTDIWLQFIVASNVDLKLDLKYFTPIFREPHAWENPNIVAPALTVRYHFD